MSRPTRGLMKWGLTPVEAVPERDVCHCPVHEPGQAPLKGRYSAKRLREQCARQGITLPVRIKVNHGLGRTLGNHTGTPGVEHVIEVNGALCVENANKTLLHELRHAEQREKIDARLGSGGMDRLYAMCSERMGYYSNPFELDAEVAAEAFVDQCPPIFVE